MTDPVALGHSQMTAAHLDASNRLGKEPEVVVTHRSLAEQSGAISIELININIYEFRTRKLTWRTRRHVPGCPSKKAILALGRVGESDTWLAIDCFSD